MDFSAVRGCVFGVIRCGGVVSCMFRVICVIRMGCVLVGVRIVMFITSVRRFGLALQCWLVARLSLERLLLCMIMFVMLVFMIVRVVMRLGIDLMAGLVRVTVFELLSGLFRRSLAALIGLGGLWRLGSRILNDLALDALAIAAAARIASAWSAPVGAVLGLLFGLAMGAFVRLDQSLTIGNWNLVVIGMDFAEGQKAVTFAAIFDKGRLQ